MFGTHDWYEISERRRKQWINNQQALDAYVELYCDQLRGLGYATVLTRLIRARGRIGRPMYHLFFATDNEAGERIMDHCFKTCFEAKQQSLLDRNF